MDNLHAIVEYLSVTNCFQFSLILQLHIFCYVSKIAYDLFKLGAKDADLDLEFNKEQTNLMTLSC